MHDSSPAGLNIRACALAYWQSFDGALRLATDRQNRSRVYLLTRAAARALAGILGGLTILASVYAVGAILLLSFS